MRREDLDLGIEGIRVLSEEIGPRPSASAEESAAALYMTECLRSLGLEARTDEFRSCRSFGPAYLISFGLAAMAGVLRRGRLRFLLGGIAAGLGLADSRFSRYGALGLVKTRTSRNVWAAIESGGAVSAPGGRGKVQRTVCLVSHMDSSRSGLMFHPRVTPFLGRLVTITGISLLIQALDPLVGRGGGRWVVLKARTLCLFAFCMVLEREVRGHDVPGANDNASGVGACMALAARFSREPLERTRVIILVTGSEESGVHGMSAFLDQHDTTDWMFINFDGVSADAPLRVLSKEGGPLGSHRADPGLMRLAAEVGTEDPDLLVEPLEYGSGLPYDATVVLASGGRAMSVVNQDGPIPDYHWPTDSFDKVSRPAFERAVRFVEAVLDRVDAGS